MTAISKTRQYTPYWLLFFLWLFPVAASGQGEIQREKFGYKVVAIELDGVWRTNPEWLIEYLGLTLPEVVSVEETLILEKRVMTTGAFTDAKVKYLPKPDEPGTYILKLEVDEKWTLIPVIRGVYGGGTPLLVLGAYDIHAAGRLWTIGAEARKYGDASPGYVVYFRDPRAFAGRYFFGAELWKTRRLRSVYNANAEPVGEITSESAIARVNVLAPITFGDRVLPGEKFAWKYGLDLKWSEEQPVTAKTLSESGIVTGAFNNGEEIIESDAGLPRKTRAAVRLLPTLLHDNVDVVGLNMDGLRATIKAGPIFEKNGTEAAFEGELFYYQVLGFDWNLAFHGFLGSISEDRFEHRYFLGGFDSIRGVPDGYLNGTRAAYSNFEARYVLDRSKYLHTQAVAFFDTGGAADAWTHLSDNRASAAGAGLRFSIPQVYRLMFRIDYAFSLGATKTQGITAGLNQFFDPYIPL